MSQPIQIYKSNPMLASYYFFHNQTSYEYLKKLETIEVSGFNFIVQSNNPNYQFNHFFGNNNQLCIWVGSQIFNWEPSVTFPVIRVFKIFNSNWKFLFLLFSGFVLNMFSVLKGVKIQLTLKSSYPQLWGCRKSLYFSLTYFFPHWPTTLWTSFSATVH